MSVKTNKLATVIHSNAGSLAGFTRPSVIRCDSERDARRTAAANFSVASYPSRDGSRYLYVAAYSGLARVETAPATSEWDAELGELRFYFS